VDVKPVVWSRQPFVARRLEHATLLTWSALYSMDATAR